MAKPSKKGQKVLEYLRTHKENRGKLSKKGLSRKIQKENPDLFEQTENGLEGVRKMVRYYTGQMGAHAKNTAIGGGNFIDWDAPINDKNDLDLPSSDEERLLPYHLETENLLILSDIHAPYHNEQALEAALKYGLENEVDSILLNGDIVDMYTISKYEKDPRKRSFKEELETAKDLLSAIRDLFPDAEIVFKTGNHEERYEKFMKVKAKELLDVSQFQLDVLLELGKFNIKYVTDKRVIRYGNLEIFHGHEVGVSSQHPALNLFRKSYTNSLAGHVHRADQMRRKKSTGEFIQTWTTGCLCEMHPEYAPYNQWVHGFAHVRRRGDKTNVYNRIIQNGWVI